MVQKIKSRAEEDIIQAIKLLIFNDQEGKMTAAEVRKILTTNFPGSYIPEIRGIQKIIKKYQDIEHSFEEKPWSLGASKKLNIPAASLIPFQKMLLNRHRYLTIRRALWIVKLFPLMGIKNPTLTDDDDLEKILLIATIYSRREQIMELNDKYLDTTDLDRIFIFDKDFKDLTFETIYGVFMNEIFPYVKIGAKSDNEPEKLAPFTDIETILGGRLTESQKKQINAFMKVFIESIYNKEAQNLAISFINENPEIKPLAQKLVAFSLRKDLIARYVQDLKEKEGE